MVYKLFSIVGRFFGVRGVWIEGQALILMMWGRHCGPPPPPRPTSVPCVTLGITITYLPHTTTQDSVLLLCVCLPCVCVCACACICRMFDSREFPPSLPYLLTSISIVIISHSSFSVLLCFLFPHPTIPPGTI